MLQLNAKVPTTFHEFYEVFGRAKYQLMRIVDEVDYATGWTYTLRADRVMHQGPFFVQDAILSPLNGRGN